MQASGASPGLLGQKLCALINLFLDFCACVCLGTGIKDFKTADQHQKVAQESFSPLGFRFLPQNC